MFPLFYEPALVLMTIAKNSLFRQILLAGLCLIYVSAADAAGNAANGKVLYNTTNGSPLVCASGACHGANPLVGMNKILRGANAGAVIMTAIRLNKGSMGFMTSYISAVQADDIGAYIANPSAADTVTQTIGEISFLPATLAVGDTTTVSAIATSGLTVSFSSTTMDICTVSGSTVTGVTAGTCAIAANQAGNASYSAATQVTQNISVSATTTPPTCILSASPTSINAGSTSLLTVNCSPAATTYLWIGGTCAGMSAASCSVTPSASTIYTVAGVNSAGSGAVAAVTVTVAPLGSILVVEFYNANINHYFMTASSDEAVALDNKPSWGWARTGKTFNVWLNQATAPGSVSPVCRFFGVFANGTVGSHFYTVDPVECANVKGRLDWGWGYENDAFYAVQPTGSSCPSGTSPVYRVYNNGMGGAPNHRYMANQADVSTMVSQGWVSEGTGTAFCGAQ